MDVLASSWQPSTCNINDNLSVFLQPNLATPAGQQHSMKEGLSRPASWTNWGHLACMGQSEESGGGMRLVVVLKINHRKWFRSHSFNLVCSLNTSCQHVFTHSHTRLCVNITLYGGPVLTEQLDVYSHCQLSACTCAQIHTQTGQNQNLLLSLSRTKLRLEHSKNQTI